MKELLKLAAKVDYGQGMDKEVIDLCNALNSLPNIVTFESCCGHGEHGMRVWFLKEEDDDQGLFFLTRCTDGRYWEYGHKWSITLSVGDCFDNGIRPTHFLLESEAVGEEAYKQAESLIDNMNYHLNHHNFMKGFDINPRAFVREGHKLNGEYDIWDWVVTKDGRLVQIDGDEMADLTHEDIERHATIDEMIEAHGEYLGDIHARYNRN